MKNLNDLARELCRREAHKRQVNIADMKETIKALRYLIYKYPVRTLQVLLKGLK